MTTNAPTAPAPDRYLDTDDAADLLGLQSRTLQRWRSERTGPPFTRLGGRIVRYRESSLIAWMTDRTVDPEH